jgi:hypothetical protein
MITGIAGNCIIPVTSFMSPPSRATTTKGGMCAHASNGAGRRQSYVGAGYPDSRPGGVLPRQWVGPTRRAISRAAKAKGRLVFSSWGGAVQSHFASRSRNRDLARWHAPPASPSPTPSAADTPRVTGGDTLFEAVNRAMNWFADPYWRGPRPRPDTVFEVTLVGDERKWRVTARSVLEWRGWSSPCMPNAAARKRISHSR